MAPVAEKIEQEFKKLAPRDQAELLERLESVVADEETEDAEFLTMLNRRVAEIESGRVKGRDAFKVLDDIKAKRGT